MSWFSNILPAIEALPQDIGNAVSGRSSQALPPIGNTPQQDPNTTAAVAEASAAASKDPAAKAAFHQIASQAYNQIANQNSSAPTAPVQQKPLTPTMQLPAITAPQLKSLSPDQTSGQSATITPNTAIPMEQSSANAAAPLINSQAGHAVQSAVNVGNNIASAAGGAITAGGNAIAAPIQQTAAYARLQMNPQAKAKLAAINSNPNLTQDQKIAQGNILMQQFGGQNATQSQGSENFSTAAMAPYSLVDPANAALGSALDTGMTAAKPIVKAAVDETKANVEANGGAQAGFVRPTSFVPTRELPQITSPENMGSYVKDENGNFVKNPNPQAPIYSAKAGELPPITSEDVTPQEQVSANPTDPAQRGRTAQAQYPALTGSEKTQLSGTNMNRLTTPDNSPQTQDFYKKVLVRDIKGVTPDQKFADLDNAQATIIKNAKAKLASAPPLNIQADVVPYIQQAVHQGVVNGLVTPIEEDQITAQASAQLGNLFKGRDVNEVSPADLFDQKPALSNMARGAYQKMQTQPSGQIAANTKANYFLQDGINNLLSAKYDNIGLDMAKYKALQEDGGLRDQIANMAYRGHSSAQKFGIPKTPITLPVGRIRAEMAAGKGSKAILPTIIGSTLLTGGALGYLGAKSQDKQTNASGQPDTKQYFQQHNGIVPDSHGDYNLPVQTTAGTTYMTQAQRQQAEATLDPSSKAYAQVEQKYDADQKRAALQLPNNTQAFMLNAPTYMKDINQSNKDLQTMPLDLLHKLDTVQKWNAYISNPSNPYAAQVARLGKLNADYIESYTAINGSFPTTMESSLIGAGDSTQQAQEKWNNIIDYVTQQYTVPGRQDAFMAVNTPTGYQNDTGGKITTPPATIPSSASSGQGVAATQQLIPDTTNQLPTSQ